MGDMARNSVQYIASYVCESTCAVCGTVLGTLAKLLDESIQEGTETVAKVHRAAVKLRSLLS